MCYLRGIDVWGGVSKLAVLDLQEMFFAERRDE